MEPILILSTMSFPDRWLDRLRAVSPRLVVKQHTATSVEAVPPTLWQSVEVLYTGSVFPESTRAPRLRWVQLDTSGVDHMLNTPLWQADVAITTLNGVAPTNMAEFALMLMLAFAHRLRRIYDYQRRSTWPSPVDRWEHFTPLELHGATVGIVGYGSIGRQIGRVARAFGMRVLGMRRSGAARSMTYRSPALSVVTDEEPDRMYTPSQLTEMLAECDYVVLVVPYTSATHHLIDAAALRTMKPTAVLINIARGSVVDEAALIQALREGWIAGAALDVFEREPLPADSPLWTMDNVIISPHIAGLTPYYYERVMALFAENLRRYLAGEILLNRVERDLGY